MTFDDLCENLSYLDDWEDRYRYIMELAATLPAYPDDKKTDAYLVKGCISRVWLDINMQQNKITFIGDSDSHLVRGLIAILSILYNHQTKDYILGVDVKKSLTLLGLDEHLTPQRSNGLFSMVNRIIDFAQSHYISH